MYATQSEIARQLGISQATVSMALRGTGKMSDETRTRIQQEAIKRGYRHNNAAQAIRTGRFGCISLLMSLRPQYSHLPFELIPGISGEARLQQIQLNLIGAPDQELASEEFIHEALRRWSSDGFLINYTHNFPPRMLELIRDYRLPSIWINTWYESDCVCPDDFATSAEAVRQLAALGHRRIGYLDLTLNRHYSGQARHDGYRHGIKNARLEPILFSRCVERPQRFDVLREWLRSGDRPSAIVAYHDNEAQSLFAAAQSLQIRVPHDLSLISIHDHPTNACGVEFSMMQNDFATVGAEAVRMLLKKIETPSKPLDSKKIAPIWIPGATIAPPK